MANEIFLNQAVTLIFTDSNGEDMDTITFRVDYWKPGNKTSTPDGTIAAGNITTVAGSPIVEIDVPKDTLDVVGPAYDPWRFQIIETTTDIGFTVMCFIVKQDGSCSGNFPV